MSDTDFTGKNVLVIGGSSGIGNGIAHAFRSRGANVEVWGTRARAEDYTPDDGSALPGCSIAKSMSAHRTQLPMQNRISRRLMSWFFRKGSLLIKRPSLSVMAGTKLCQST